jgi:glycosyltransferase involved in cell wall biosynthesis
MLRNIVKSLPSPIQRAAFGAVQFYNFNRHHINLVKERPFRSFQGKHVAVVGFFSSGTGVARAAEFVALTLEGRGSKVVRIDISSSIRKAKPDERFLSPADCYSLDISDVVFVVNPGQPSISTFKKKWLLERTIIGHWIWELDRVPELWKRASESYDEIWAATDLLKDSIQATLSGFDRPLKVMPYAIHEDPFPNVDIARRAIVREREQFSSACFVIGYSFAVGSNYARKNPEDAVRAFFDAFPENENVRLLLRSNDLSDWPIQRAALERVVNGDSRVVIYDKSRHIGIHDFYAAIDVYLSPSRAEGYGLNLVEAAQSGLPVITGGWRIAPEILALDGVHEVGFDIEKVDDPQGHYTRIRDAVWSKPRVNELSSVLKTMYSSR